MTDAQKELLYDLIVKRVTEGLNSEERQQLDGFDPELVKAESRAIASTAAAINMAGIDVDPMPPNLFASIAAAAPAVLKAKEMEFDGGTTIPSMARIYTAEDVFERRPRNFILGVFGWVAAAILLIVVGVQFYNGRIKNQPEKAVVGLPTPSVPVTPDLAQRRDELLRTASDVVSATWAPGNMKDLQVTGDVVWSDSKQQGFLRFHGLPTNDPAKTSYQLWIYDKTQDQATPIDGGIFDVSSNGEVVVPIDAKLKASRPEMFAVTVEKPGGVVVSKKEKIAALAKVETKKT
jgi:hypothetical protein